MTARRCIAVVTGSRADYGLLYPVMKAIQKDDDLKLKVLVTGMHLAPEFGSTYSIVEQDGFVIDAKIENLLCSDTPVGVTKSLGLGLIGFADALQRLKPDMLLVLGDRFEIFAAVQTALLARIPVAHIAGGDRTEGAYDEAIRHSISKMAHLHFTTNFQAAQRLRQLGENPEHIFNTGSPALDQLNQLKLLGKSELENELGIKFHKRNLLITFHPTTLDIDNTGQLQQLLTALDRLGDSTALIFTKSNADNSGRQFGGMIDEYVAPRPHATAFTSLGQLRYYSLMAHMDAVVGNSSSGLYEAPSLHIPTVNIGDRQRGRLQAPSVINCRPIADEIEQAISEAYGLDCSEVTNPYGDGHSTERIISVLKKPMDLESLVKKRFFDMEPR